MKISAVCTAPTKYMVALSLITTLATVSALGHPAIRAQEAQPSEFDRQAPDLRLDEALAEWRTHHGSAWQVVRSPSGFAEMLFGGWARAAAGHDRAPSSEADAMALARHFVASTAALHGIRTHQLVEPRAQFLPLGTGNTTDKWTVRLRQELSGVAVDGGWVNVLLSLGGELLSIQSTCIPRLDNLSVVPTIGAERAREISAAAFAQRHGAEPDEHSAGQLMIVHGPGHAGTLAWKVDVKLRRPGAAPLGEAVTVDARTGQVVALESLVHHFDVFGQVVSNATPGVLPDDGSNSPQPLPMPYMEVSSSVGTVHTDQDGNFVFPGIDFPLSVTFEYRGLFNETSNGAGPKYSLATTLQPNTPNAVVMNPSPTEYVTSQANAFLNVARVRDYVRDVNPLDATADFVSFTLVNDSGVCNAFASSPANALFHRSSAGCTNMAYSTVVGHELGHLLNSRYGTGNGFDGMGEGNADMWAMYVYDGPIVGRNHCGPGCHFRSGNNTVMFCGDFNPGCYGQVHEDGKVWMGAGWKIRRNLKQTHGGSLGSQIADNLFVGWMNAFDQTEIKSIIELQWLTLDDDDGNIANGTPNHADIDGAFREQGFPGHDIHIAQFDQVTVLPDTLDPGPFSVSAEVVPLLAPVITSVVLRWREGGGAFQDVLMGFQGGDVYAGVLPAQSIPAYLEYYFVATDSQGQTESYPFAAPDDLLDFGVGHSVTLLDLDFEATGDQGWVGSAPGDDATSGLWVRDDPVGTLAQPGEDVSVPGTKCWFTGQGMSGAPIGANDVDDGRTTLRSPILDASGVAGLELHYWRWYSNDEGGQASADIFEVDVSNDAGATWHNVEVVGPEGQEASGGWFERSESLADLVPATDSMQVRFVASDLGVGSILEAAIDEVRLRGFQANCPDPLNYCLTTPNSVGAGGRMGFDGSASLAANDLTLKADQLPAGQPGLFFYGRDQVQVPFGNGLRCAGGQIVRLPLTMTTAAGAVAFDVDSSALPGGDVIAVGEYVYFQYWYRDPAAGGPAFSFTDGLAARFCP